MSELIQRFKNQYFKTKKSLGQHFLTNNHFVKEIAECAVIERSIPVIEIGPGCGVVTYELAKLADQLTVIDIDTNAAEFLNNNKDEFFPNINIINDDFLNVRLDELYQKNIVIVGNLPYNVSVKILEHCTRYADTTDRMVFMFQKEVAARISAQHGSKDYSSLSVFTAYYYDIKKIRDISGSNFWPNANVMSTVLLFTPKQERLLSEEDEKGFFLLLRQAFHQKRKTLNNNLKSYIKLSEALEKLNLPKSVRAEEIPLNTFVEIYKHVKL